MTRTGMSSSLLAEKCWTHPGEEEREGGREGEWRRRRRKVERVTLEGGGL